MGVVTPRTAVRAGLDDRRGRRPQGASAARSRAVGPRAARRRSASTRPATNTTARRCTASYAGLVTSPCSSRRPSVDRRSSRRLLMQRTLRLAAAVGLLVEAVDGDGVVRCGALEPVAPVRGALGVGEAAGIDDERMPVGVGLDAQGVVVSVTAVAERAAAEHQEALVGERARRPVSPPAALHVVAPDGEVGAALGRRGALSTLRRDVTQVGRAQGVARPACSRSG